MAITYLSGQRIQGESFTAGGTTESGATSGTNPTQSEASWKQITGLTAGAPITHMLWDRYDSDAMDFKFALYDDDSDTPNNRLGNEVTIALSEIDNVYTTQSVPTSGSPVVPSDGIVWVANMAEDNDTVTNRGDGGSAGDSRYSSLLSYSTGFEATATTTLSGSNNYRAGVITGGVGDEKPTDVPVGSQFEETNTRKFYHFGATGRALTIPQSKYTVSGNRYTRLGTGWDGYVSTASGDLASTNPSITEITNAGGGSEYIAFTWYDSSGLPRGQSSGSWDENTMAYGFYFTTNSADGVIIRIDGTNANGYTASEHSYSSSDTFKIEMTSTTVKFYQDTGSGYTELHTCDSTSGSGGSSEVPDASKTYYLISAINADAVYLEAKSPTTDWIERGTAL